MAIRTKCNSNSAFSFREVRLEQTETEISLMKLNKESQYSDIPTKTIKENSDISLNFICKSINSSIKLSLFSSCLKHAHVTPLHKKRNESLKGQQVYPQFYQKYLRKANVNFFDDIFSKYQYGFRKGFSTQ